MRVLNIIILYSQFSEIENEDEVMHSIQLRFEKLAVENKYEGADDRSDYGIDSNQGPAVPSSDDIISTSSNSVNEGE